MIPSLANDNNLGYESLGTSSIVIYHQDSEATHLNLWQLESHLWDFADMDDGSNNHGVRTGNRRPFTGASVRGVLANRFYEGEVIYRRGEADQQVVDRVHKVPEDVKTTWLLDQEVEIGHRTSTAGHPSAAQRNFPFSRVLFCQRCGSPCYGEAENRIHTTEHPVAVMLQAMTA